MKQSTFKERFSYWFDQKMSRGSLSLIKLLAAATIVIIVAIAFLIFIFGLNEDGGFLSAFWDSLATTINAWMPYYEDGGPGYLILTAIASVAGLLITSILIGIVSSAIEEKVNDLKHSSSRVLEEGHIVVLGFYPGEYTLISQLVLSAEGEQRCIVVAGETDQEEMTLAIRENVEVPENIRIVCRTVDLFDPVALERCTISGCRSVVISPTDDYRITKMLLAVSSIPGVAENKSIRISAIVSKKEYSLPPSIAHRFNVTMLQGYEMIARIVARSCTQPGLSDTFCEMFRFEGAELYAESIEGAVSEQFESIVERMEGGVPIGILREGKTIVFPAPDMTVRHGDRIILFADAKNTAKLRSPFRTTGEEPEPLSVLSASRESVAIIGGNESLPIILRELPDSVSKIVIAAGAMRYKDEAMRISDEKGSFAVSFYSGDISQRVQLEELVKRVGHIVVLSDHVKPGDDADMESILMILNLRDIRERLGLSYNITAEMRREYNQKLISTDDNTDFIVASNISSLILAQLAECPELIGALTELLSNDGSELYLKKASDLSCTGRCSVADMRQAALAHEYVMIGYRKKDEGHSVLNPPLTSVPDLGEDDSLIVIGSQ